MQIRLSRNHAKYFDCMTILDMAPAVLRSCLGDYASNFGHQSASLYTGVVNSRSSEIVLQSSHDLGILVTLDI